MARRQARSSPTCHAENRAVNLTGAGTFDSLIQRYKVGLAQLNSAKTTTRRTNALLGSASKSQAAEMFDLSVLRVCFDCFVAWVSSDNCRTAFPQLIR